MSDGVLTGEISSGLLLFVGFEESDTKEDFLWSSKKITQMRIFPDENLVMNLSVKDVLGDILVVSQFTLFASTQKGNRPSYYLASPPEKAKSQYQEFLVILEELWGKKLQTGIFGADMKVELLNDGPITIWLDSRNRE
ncbi:MAG: D-tyrosyl-tRNA(Tyr) deacylase [Flavobacteriaceae bacterium]|nr:MAG: D-tyrosyl-tRNA(Tyr) deacylase [Flavobacteriaceae bacterium]